MHHAIRHSFFATQLLLAGLALGFLGCEKQPRPSPGETPLAPAATEEAIHGTSGGPTAGSSTGGATATASLSEGEVARLSELVNTAEVEQGKVAQAKAKATKVKQFAGMMVEHHQRALLATADLVKKLGITPADSALGVSLKADAATTLEKLKASAAADFDAVYLAAQVEGHQKVLDLIDQKAVPTAKTPEAGDALRKARQFVANHLKQAQELQAK